MLDFSLLTYDTHSLGIDIFYDGEKIGYVYWDTVDDDLGNTSHTVVHMELEPAYQHQKITPTILERYIEDTGEQIKFGEVSDTESDDGSHLIGDGPEFVKAWKEHHS